MALWQGINQGLRTGLAFASDRADREQRQQQFDEAKAERTEERTYQRGRQEKADATQRAQVDLTVAKEADSEAQRLALGGLQGAGVDEGRLTAAQTRAKQARNNAYKQLGYGDFEEVQRQSAAVLQKLDQGTGIENLSAPELGLLSYQLKRPITDFIDTPDRPAPASLAFSVFADAAEKGDMEGILAGANELLRPEIEDGIGGKNAKGDVIVDKFLSGVETRGDKAIGQLTVRARKADGTEYDYDAPITEGRVAGGKPLAISLDAVMDRLNKTGQLLETLNSDPQKAAIVAGTAAEWERAGGKDQFQKLYQAYIAAGGDPKALKGKVTRDQITLNDRVLDREFDENGRLISTTEYKQGVKPKEADPAGDALKYAQAAYYREGKGGRGGAGGRRGGGANQDEYIANIETGEWMPWDGKPGDKPPPGFSPPFKAGQKPTDIGPGTLRELTDKQYEQDLKLYEAELKAAPPGTKVEKPTRKAALAKVKADQELFTEIEIDDAQLDMLKGKTAKPADKPAPKPATKAVPKPAAAAPPAKGLQGAQMTPEQRDAAMRAAIANR